jgi:hypothetical protein
LPTVAELAQQELSRRYSLQGRTQVAPRVQTMQNARPTVRSALSNLMRDAVDATGLEGGYRQGLLNAAGGVETAVDFLPVVGDVLGLEDASRAYGQGDMVGAGINMMGVVPVVGDVAVRDFSFMKWDKLGIDPNEVYDLANNQLLLDNVLGGISQAKTMDDLQYVVESYSPDEMRLYKNLVEPELAEIRDSASRYDVNLNVSPEELLDWDAPLSEQSEKVQNALGRNDKWTTGASFYHLKSGAIDDQLTEKSGELYDFIQSHPKFNAEKRNFSSREVISSWLNSKGVSGIKYYDGFSRMLKKAQETTSCLTIL